MELHLAAARLKDSPRCNYRKLEYNFSSFCVICSGCEQKFLNLSSWYIHSHDSCRQFMRKLAREPDEQLLQLFEISWMERSPRNHISTLSKCVNSPIATVPSWHGEVGVPTHIGLAWHLVKYCDTNPTIGSFKATFGTTPWTFSLFLGAL